MNAAILKRLKFSLLVLALAALVAAPAARAQDEEDDFQPRSSAPPGNRTGGASRSGKAGEQPPPTVSLLAPAKSVGLTTRAQPVIYWYLSADTEHPVMVSLTDPAKREDTVEATIKGPTKAGVHRFDFASLKRDGGQPVKLEPGVKYELVVEVVARKGTGGSENPSATCRIMRLDPKDAAALAPAEKEQDLAKRASAYGKQGVWFDYIDALNAAVEKKPGDEALLQRRAKALAAQGLAWTPDGAISEKNGR